MEQAFYYEIKDGKLIMYLCDLRERYIAVIPSKHEDLYKHFKGCQLGRFITLEQIIDIHNLRLIEFEDLNKINV